MAWQPGVQRKSLYEAIASHHTLAIGPSHTHVMRDVGARRATSTAWHERVYSVRCSQSANHERWGRDEQANKLNCEFVVCEHAKNGARVMIYVPT